MPTAERAVLEKLTPTVGKATPPAIVRKKKPKGPNPLSVKKKTKQGQQAA